MQVKLSPAETYPVCPCTFVINGKPYHQVRIPYSPMFEVTNEIRLNSGGNKLESVLMILSQQMTYVPIEECKAIIDDASKYLGVRLEIQLRDVAAGILSANDPKLVVDLDPGLLSLALRLVYEQIDADHADELSNSAITYIDASERTPQ